jgi:hypothetical protein
MHWIVTDPRGVEAALREPVLEVNVLPWIQEQPAFKRLDIYAEAYFLRLVEALAEDYPRAQQALGLERFRVLVAEYLKVYPSTTPDIGEVGRRLLEFVLVGGWEPFLADVILSEQLARASFLTEEPPDFDTSVLAAISPEQWASAHLVVNPSLRWIASAWNLNEIWQGQAPREATEVSTYAIHGYTIRVLGELERATLRRFIEGASLGEVIGELNASEEAVMSLFSGWIHNGTIADIRF